MDLGNRLIVALDVPDRPSADKLADAVGDNASWVKIGLELFIAAGPELVREYAAAGRRVMLDLKLHDIPATVERATRRAANLGARLLTIHAGGGRAMMEAAARAARESGGDDRLRILAVTVLTSMTDDDVAAIGAGEPVEALVVRRARLAAEAGCDGVVCSPAEARLIRDQVTKDFAGRGRASRPPAKSSDKDFAGRGRASRPPAKSSDNDFAGRGQQAPTTSDNNSFLIVTPGVRPAGAARGDQARVTTPAEAIRNGADLVVVGRPIRDADSPGKVASQIAAELAAELPGA